MNEKIIEKLFEKFLQLDVHVQKHVLTEMALHHLKDYLIDQVWGCRVCQASYPDIVRRRAKND